MQGSILLVLAAIVGVVIASPTIDFRVGGTQIPASNDFHACLVMVERADIPEGSIAFGGATIVTRNRALTAAHVVRGATGVSVGFYNTRFEANRFRRVVADYWLPQQGFNSTDFLNDLAVLFFPDNSFPAANVLPVAISAPAPGSLASLASYGFTSPDSTSPNQFPLLAEQTIATCTAAVKVTATHFCAAAAAPIIVCPGANGGGLYTGSGASKRLVGLVSLIPPDCTVPVGETTTLTGCTMLSSENTQRFLISQNIIPSDV